MTTPPSRRGLAGPGWARWPTSRTVLRERIVDEVAICLPFSQWQYTDGIAHVAEEAGKIVRVPVDVLDHSFAQGKVEDLDGTPVYSLVSGPDRALALLLKRAVDLGVAAVALVLLAPLLLLIAWAVRRADGGPALFRQARVGLHGRPFQILKFRSMAVGAEAKVAELAGANEIDGHAFKVTARPARHAHRPAPASLEPGRAATALERLARGHEPRGSAAAPGERGLQLRPVAPPPALHEAGHHRSVAGALAP